MSLMTQSWPASTTATWKSVPSRCVAFTCWTTSWATTVKNLPFAVLVMVEANLYVRCWKNFDSSSPVPTRKCAGSRVRDVQRQDRAYQRALPWRADDAQRAVDGVDAVG